MDAAVLVEIDQFGGAGGAAEDGLGNRARLAGQGQHHAVVDRVGVSIEDGRATHALGRCLDGVHHGGTLALAEVRHALDQVLALAASDYHSGALNHSQPASILDLSVSDFLARLGSAEPVPGGGAAAALSGAIGAALVEMTANLTLGRPKLADVQDQARQVETRAAELRQRLADLAKADALAYARVRAAYQLPRDSDALRAERTAAIQTALAEVARVPLTTAQRCAELLELADAAAPTLNAAVISDVLVGALLAEAALESAAVNVEVNLATMTDRATVERLEAELRQARAGARDRLARILATGRSRFPGGRS
jgi:formiminotetrahydrofolate cyclodeaminase